MGPDQGRLNRFFPRVPNVMRSSSSSSEATTAELCREHEGSGDPVNMRSMTAWEHMDTHTRVHKEQRGVRSHKHSRRAQGFDI